MRILLLISIFLLANISHATENSILDFDQLGFQIKALEGKSDSITSTPLTLMLPLSNGFSPNITVIMQPYKGSIENYKAVTDQQLKQANLNVIQSEIIGGIYTFEYSGSLTGQNLHVYSKAQMKGNHIYLTTATDLMIQWDLNKNKLLNTVNSFKFKE
ncbi:MAG: hypothetical protein PVG41_10265 [Desulfobacteraceae bacterium]